MSTLGYPWRIGSQVGRTLYIATGEKHPSNLFGLVDDDECAQHIVDLHNAWWAAQHEQDPDHYRLPICDRCRQFVGNRCPDHSDDGDEGA